MLIMTRRASIPTPASGTPAYIAALAGRQVKECTTTSSGNDNLRSVTPAEWRNNDPEGPGNTAILANVIKDYSGGFKVGSSGTQLYVHGGGHLASANNGIYPYDFFGTTAPYGFRAPSISAVADVTGSGPYSDGAARAVHTYDVGAMLGLHFYRERGAQYDDGGNPGFWRKPTSGGSWQQLTANPNVSGSYTNRGSLLPDEASGKLFSFVDNFNFGYFYRPGADTWSSGFNLGFNWGPGGSYPISIRGPGNECVVFGGGLREKLIIDYSAESVSVTDLTTSGSDSICDVDGISGCYDSINDCYWLWGGGAGSAGWSNLYKVNRSTWAITALSLTGDTITTVPGMIGSWSRFVYMEAWRAIGLVNDVDDYAFVVRVP